MVGYSSDGIWQDLEIGSATASIKKKSNEDKIVVTVGPIHKEATISSNSGDKVLSGKAVGLCFVTLPIPFPCANL